MRRLLVVAAVIPLLLANGPAPAQAGYDAENPAGQSPDYQSNGRRQMNEADARWLDYAATDNQGEIQECLFAEKRAHSLALKAFVRLMVHDHVQLESQLAALVNGQSATVPVGPGHKAMKLISELEPLRGQQFDRRFIEEQVKDHREDIQKYSEQVRKTQDPAIRRFAAEGLPILQQHLALAEAVQKLLNETELGVSGPTGSQSPFTNRL